MTASPQEVDRGGELTVTGRAWGTDCYDTGPPPDGEGGLGRPVTGIEIVLTQGDNEWVLATVDADDDYSFEEKVVVPPEAEPGDTQLTAGQNEPVTNALNTETTLRISPEPPISAPPTIEPTTVPTTTESPALAPTAPESAESGSIAPWLTGASVVVTLAAVASAAAIRRKSS